MPSNTSDMNCPLGLPVSQEAKRSLRPFGIDSQFSRMNCQPRLTKCGELRKVMLQEYPTSDLSMLSTGGRHFYSI
jgi:hypothetical protein